MSKALVGLHNAYGKLATSAENVSKGDLDIDNLLEFKQDSNNVKIQEKNLSLQAEAERRILDILA